MAEVLLQDVSKTFGDVVALEPLQLDVPDREFMVLLGPSGCGKSTLLRIVCGLEVPTTGEVRIGDRVVNDVEPKERDVAMVFQSYALYPHKSVRANIEFPLKVRGEGRAERASAADEAASILGLTEYMDRKPAALSGGQRQRVALARAIVRQPAVFCMDEPLSNLDAKLRAETRAEIVSLHQRLGTTFLYVTHDQVEAMTMSTRVAVMSRGVIQQVGSPQEVYDRPQTVFVAQFIGTPPMNIFPPGSMESGEHLVGVRPEHIRIDGGDGLAATVSLIEHLGHEILVACMLPAGERIMVRVSGEAEVPGVGQAVFLAVPPSRLHRFDPTTTERLG